MIQEWDLHCGAGGGGGEDAGRRQAEGIDSPCLPSMLEKPPRIEEGVPQKAIDEWKSALKESRSLHGIQLSDL